MITMRQNVKNIKSEKIDYTLKRCTNPFYVEEHIETITVSRIRNYLPSRTLSEHR